MGYRNAEAHYMGRIPMKTSLFAILACSAISTSASAAILQANSTNIYTVFAAAQGGDTIKLSGTFGALWLKDRTFTTRVTLDATSAVFTDMLTINKVSGMNVNGGTFGSMTSSLPILSNVRVENSANVKFQGNKFVGNGATYTGLANVGMVVANSSYVEVSVGTFSNLSTGVQVRSSARVNLNNNKYNAMTSDGIQISDSHFVTALRNNCTGTTPYAGAHPDCIQLWSVAGKPVQSDIKLLNNTASGSTQGFTSFNPENGGGLRISMIGNLVGSSWPQGMACYGCVDSIFTDNIFTTPSDAGWQLQMFIIGGRNNVIANNTFTPWSPTPTANVSRLLAGLDTSAASTMSQGMTTTINAVPEPGEWAMFIIGFGLVGAFIRRSKLTMQRPLA
jgi:opacity protein-like surface antigen